MRKLFCSLAVAGAVLLLSSCGNSINSTRANDILCRIDSTEKLTTKDYEFIIGYMMLSFDAAEDILEDNRITAEETDAYERDYPLTGDYFKALKAYNGDDELLQKEIKYLEKRHDDISDKIKNAEIIY